MPQYITIKNFGPITSIEKMEVKDFMLFIGERATGKSTIAKLIYFFKYIVHELNKDCFAPFRYSNVLDQYTIDTFYESIKVLWRQMEIERVFKKAGTEIYYYYGDDTDKYVEFKNDTFQLSSAVREYVDGIFNEIELLRVKLKRKSKSGTFNINQIETDTFLEDLVKRNADFFSVCDLYYLPANRTFDLGGKTDKISDEYWQLGNRIRNTAGWQSIGEGSILHSYSREILLGNIIMQPNAIGIMLYDGKEIPIAFASSGQQESFWILVVLFFLLERHSNSIIIEEPEAGLDPKTQSLILEAIALFGNHSNDGRYNQVIITTHSPFILNTLGNILYASKLSKEHEEEREELAKLGFTPELLLDPERVAVHKCINGGVESIMEDGRVNNEEIDNISTETLNALDSLIDIELKYENEV